MKHEWKKHEKKLYGATAKPAVVTVPEQKFISIAGTGDPNGPDFAERIGVLYSLAYPIKMRHKASCAADPHIAKTFDYTDWTIFPLEGVWTSPENAPLDKSRFEYVLMIRQSDFVTKEMFAEALAVVKMKKPHPFLEQVAFEAVEEGLCVQMLHVGPYDAEPTSFALMDEFSMESGLKREGVSHREIYLNDARKTDPAKYRTILRYRVHVA